MNETIQRILAGIACEVGQLDGTIAALSDSPARRDEMARRDGLRRALRIAADIAEVDAAELAKIAAVVISRTLADELKREAAAERESANV
jgi:hypothetical protein